MNGIAYPKSKFDAKWRIVIPAKHRAKLGDHVVCTIGMDRSVAVYSSEEWKSYEQKLKTLSYGDPNNRKFILTIASFAETSQIDNSGRILISQALRDYANLTEEVAITDAIDHLEIWNYQKWTDSVEDVLDKFSEIAQEVSKLGI